MSLSKQKIELLSDYYLKNGFDHTTDEIVRDLNISRKTFFNRYKSKETSIDLVIENWFENIKNRFSNKVQHCNHAVEELLQLIYEIHYIDINENVFFKFLLSHNLLVSEEAPFWKIVQKTLQKGISHYQFREDFNVDLYVFFLLNNLTHYVYKHEYKDEIVNFLLAPILSDRGKTLLEEMDLTSFL